MANTKLVVFDYDRFKLYLDFLYERFYHTVKNNVRYSAFRVERYEELREYNLNTACSIYKYLIEYNSGVTNCKLAALYKEFCDKIENFDISEVYNEVIKNLKSH